MTEADEPAAPILTTATGEPFQPVRLFFEIPGRGVVQPRLRALRGIRHVRGSEWVWSRPQVGVWAGERELDDDAWARLRLPKRGGMTLQTGSVPRAIAGARVLAEIFGDRARLVRARIVNRCFPEDAGGLEALFEELDRNVTVIDPEVAARELERDMAGVQSMEAYERRAAARMNRRLAEGHDVPDVEDFPLHPEEETEDFLHLTTTLGLRMERAVRRANGEPVTLTRIIVERVERERLGEVDE